MARPKTLKKCTFCKKDVYRLAGHGLCANCYYREKRNGTPDYVKVRKPCSVEGCTNLSAAQGLCPMHYVRLRRHGVVEGERFARWGHGSSHPMYGRWDWLKRERKPIAPEWKDFWQFVRDVGAPPSQTHRIWRVDTTKPYGPTNFEWRDRATDVPLKARSEYMRAYRMTRPRQSKDADLKKHYGIGIEDFDAMFAAQSGVCAICSKPERAVDKKTQQIRDLAVDHDHETGAVRGLLCSGCNTSLGAMNDDPKLLRAAADYIERHQTDEADT